jgi:Fe2+ or Zn2+ uptake regulation protein
VHFRCTECGGVQCLDMKLPKPPSLPRGFRLTSMELDIRGECPHCARKHP